MIYRDYFITFEIKTKQGAKLLVDGNLIIGKKSFSKIRFDVLEADAEKRILSQNPWYDEEKHNFQITSISR